MSQSSNLPPPRYQFFILGLWQERGNQPGRQAAWRISLEDPRTAQRSGFTNLADLEAFLAAWMVERVSGEQ
jgi:hypothetical protein